MTQNIIKLTESLTNQSGRLLRYSAPVSSTEGLSITFDFYAYGGTGGDGISFFFVDGSKNIEQPGGFGGSLGYAPYITATETQPGLVGGYLGIGLDSFGSYSAPSEGRVGGPGVIPDSVVVRGSEASNYAYLAGTTLPNGQSLDFPGAEVTQAQAKRTAKIDLSPTGVLSVKIDLNNNGSFSDAGEDLINNLNVTTTNGALPSTFKFGFSAATGAATNVQEVGNFNVRTFNGTAIPGSFTGDLVIVNPPGTPGGNVGGGSGNDVIQGGGKDVVTGQAGNDVLIGGGNPTGGGGNTLTGGAGGDRFYFRGVTRAAALRSSLVRALDKITDFSHLEGDRFGLDYDDNLATVEKPRGLFNSGREKGSLLKATQSAYADKDQKRRGNQALKANEAVFFRLGSRTFVSVNDNKAAFSAKNDLVAEVTGIALKAGDAKRGALGLADYFVV